MDDLGLHVPLTELSMVTDIRGLSRLLGQHWVRMYGDR